MLQQKCFLFYRTTMGQCCSDNTKDIDGEIKLDENSVSADHRSKSKQKKPSEESRQKSGSKSGNNIKSSASKTLLTSQCGSVTSDRLAQRKLAQGPGPKIKVDMKKIMANLREKQTMRSDVALIGTGGRVKSAAGKLASAGHLKSAASSDQGGGGNDTKCNKSPPRMSSSGINRNKNNNNSRQKAHSDHLLQRCKKKGVHQKSTNGEGGGGNGTRKSKSSPRFVEDET